MIRRPPRSTLDRSSAASDVYKRQVNELQPYAQCVIIEGNKIVFVGSDDEAKNIIDDKTKIVNLYGKLMLPGFNDNHVHFISGGFYLLGIDLRPAKSTTEFKRILNDYCVKYPGKWITGGYWDHEKWEVNDLPTKEMIDEVVSNQPVFVDRLDGHMACLLYTSPSPRDRTRSRMPSSA